MYDFRFLKIKSFIVYLHKIRFVKILVKIGRFHKIWILGICFSLVLFLIEKELLKSEFSETTNIDRMNSKQRHSWMKLMELKMETRTKKLQQKCKYLGLDIRGDDSLHKPNEREFLINRPFRLVWCNVFKAASTSWMYNFNILAGYKPEFLQKSKEVPLALARIKYPRPTLKNLEEALNDSVSFLIIRHPFERLLSAYRDKIQFALPNTYHYKLKKFLTMKCTSRKEKNKGNDTSAFKLKNKNKDRSTFFKFVQFLIGLHQAGKPLDMHWAPITSFCTPCQIRFDIIMKFETLQDDQLYLINKKNLQKWIKPQWKNRGKGRENLTSLLQKYYAQINSTQLFQLYNIYKYDFYLFNYRIDEYLKYLNLSKTEVQEFFTKFQQERFGRPSTMNFNKNNV